MPLHGFVSATPVWVGHSMPAAADSMVALAAFTETDAAGMPPAAHVAELSDSEQTVLSLGGSALLEHAECAMLDLDDEMAALIAAAAVPADQAGTHGSGPEAVPGDDCAQHALCI